MREPVGSHPVCFVALNAAEVSFLLRNNKPNVLAAAQNHAHYSSFDRKIEFIQIDGPSSSGST
jgi:hypothetical protein